MGNRIKAVAYRTAGISLWRSFRMRLVGLGLIGAVSLVASANAAPIVGDLGTQTPNIIKAAGGCGFGSHPNRWGECVPNRYGAYRMNPYEGGIPYSGGGSYRTYRADHGAKNEGEGRHQRPDRL